MKFLNPKHMLLVSAFGVVTGFLVFEPIIMYFKGSDQNKELSRNRVREEAVN